MKKLFTFILALVASVLLAQATVYNGTCGAEGTDGDNITWSLNTEDSTLVLTGSGTMANYDNSSNRAPWYQYRSFVKTLTLGEGITNIGEYAFYYLQNAKTVNLPTTVETIERYGFYWCTGMQNLNFATPSSLLEIKESAFSGIGCTSITLPEGLTTIGTYGISSCSSLVEVNLPSTLTTLGSYAFRQCRRLVLTVPSSVTSIAFNAFQWLPNVFYNGTATGSPWGAKAINGYQEGWLVYESSAKTKLCACDVDAYGEIIIPESVTEIGDWAFGSATKITSVVLPSNLTKIGQYAFDNCSKMAMFASWPSTLTSIESEAFKGCNAFTSFFFPSGVTKVAAYLFYGCSNLESVYLHSNIKSVESNAFQYCSKLRTITCDAPQPPTMPSLASSSPFNGIALEQITLRVACEAKALYKTAPVWKLVGTIEGIGAPTMTVLTNNAAWGTAELTEQDCFDITLTATPNSGYFFIQWSDGDWHNPRQLTIQGDSTLTAIFSNVEPPCYNKESEFSITAEGSYTWNSQTLTESGDYQQTFTIDGGCDSIVTLHLTITLPQKWTNGVLPGEFSVAENKRVKFSQGVLQFNAAQETHATADGSAQGTWRFAESQYYLVREANANISSTYDGWFDLFGWGTSGYNNTTSDPSASNYQPWSTTITTVGGQVNTTGYGPALNMPDSDLVGTSANYDWGVYNAISNGGNQPGLWRTLSLAEWEYVLYERPNASNLYTQATVAGLKGIIILPDRGITGANFTPTTSNWTANSYSKAEWVALEEQGAVFFPAVGGYRYSPTMPFEDGDEYSVYWTTTCTQRRQAGWCGGSYYARAVYWGSSGDDGCSYGGHFMWARARNHGYRVRLVQETESTCTDKTYEFSETAETSYEWNGTTYTESGDYQQTFPMSNGCDSIVTLHLTITGEVPLVNYSLRLNGQYVTNKNCSDIASHISGITKVDPAAESQLVYNEETNTLTMQNVKLTTSDVTWALFNQIDGLTIEVLDTCILHAPYCIALRTDKNLTIRGANSNAYLKVLNDGPLDHQVGTGASGSPGMCYTALTTFNSASLTIEDCTVQAEGAGGIKAQESSLVTLKNVHLTAKVIGTPTSDAQRAVMYTFMANVEPVLIDCEPISPEGLEFSSTLGGYAVNGELTRDEIEINTVPESDVAYVCDFTKQANGHSYYSDEWTYDNDWLIFGGANYNAAWNYCKFGGKQATLTTANPVYIKSAQPLQKDITKIKVYIHEGSLAREGMSINEWGITTLNQDGSVDETYTIPDSIITNSSLIFIFAVSDNLAPHFSAGHYFQIYWDLANTTTTNGMIWIDKVEFLSEKENPTTGIEERNTDMQSATVKFIRNGQLFIRRGNELYNAQGARVK